MITMHVIPHGDSRPHEMTESCCDTSTNVEFVPDKNMWVRWIEHTPHDGVRGRTGKGWEIWADRPVFPPQVRPRA